MSKAIKILLAIASLMLLGSCASFFISSQQEDQFSLWSGAPTPMTLWNWLGIILLALASALALAAHKLYRQDRK